MLGVLIKLQVFRPATLLKKTPTQVFSCEICEIFKNTFFSQNTSVRCFCTYSNSASDKVYISDKKYSIWSKLGYFESAVINPVHKLAPALAGFHLIAKTFIYLNIKNNRRKIAFKWFISIPTNSFPSVFFIFISFLIALNFQ